MAQLNVQIDDALHRKAKIAAVQADMTLKQLVERGLELAVADVERKQARRRR